MTDRRLAPRPRRAVRLLTLLGALGAAPFAPAQDAYVGPSQARLKADVAFLAADAQEGRGPGTKGIDAAADYIAAAYAAAGLKPAPGAEGYFQPFSIRGDARLAGPTALSFRGPDRTIRIEADDFAPLAIGSSASLEGVPIVFAGYGITAHDRKVGVDYDDYAGLDVKGKAVLVLRREPQMDSDASPFAGKQTTTYAGFNHKMTNAFQHGAAAVLLVNDLGGLKGNEDRLLAIGGAGAEQNSPIPFLMISRKVADNLLGAAKLPPLAELERGIDADLKPRSAALPNFTVAARADIARDGVKIKNVIGVLEGEGPLKDETIVVGGHYDHLGSGGLTSGSLAPFSRDIHNGADDNASGTAMVMELARRLGKRVDPLPRRVVFMAFSGEEKGLLGSRHYTAHPLYPLAQTVMMVNFDMVGRLNEKDELTMVGVGSTPGLEELVDSLGRDAGFKIKKVKGVSDGFGGSDHESFYDKKVPVLFPFTGLHTEYHRPSDDTDRINFPGMRRIADYGEVLLLDLARRPTRPEFVPPVVAAKSNDPHAGGMPGGADPGRVGTRASLGTIPDYAAEGTGVKLSGVREDSPAAKAGIQGGDTIIGFAGKPISSIYDYTDALGRANPGEVVDVVVKRDGKEVTLKVTLGSRSGQ